MQYRGTDLHKHSFPKGINWPVLSLQTPLEILHRVVGTPPYSGSCMSQSQTHNGCCSLPSIPHWRSYALEAADTKWMCLNICTTSQIFNGQWKALLSISPTCPWSLSKTNLRAPGNVRAPRWRPLHTVISKKKEKEKNKYKIIFRVCSWLTLSRIPLRWSSQATGLQDKGLPIILPPVTDLLLGLFYRPHHFLQLHLRTGATKLPSSFYQPTLK